jgi:glycosyltransferase involved in cell wall biosynthesis
MHPIVSIIIPNKNRCDELVHTLASVRDQTFKDFECLIIDDNSQENVEHVIAEYLKDERFRLIRQSRNRSGAPAARNEGVRQARGTYVVFLDSDDLLAESCLENRVRIMDSHPQLDFGVFGCELFRVTPGDVGLLWNADTDENDLDRFLRHDVPWQTTGPIWRRSTLEKVGGWDEAARSAQDWEFHIRTLLSGVNYERFGPPDFYWRMAGPDRGSIGKSSVTDKAYHLARLDLYRRVRRHVVAAGKLDENRRKYFACMYFQACEQLGRNVGRRDARHAWRAAWEDKLVSRATWWRGLILLARMKWKHRFERAKLKLQDRFVLPRSTTFMKTLAASRITLKENELPISVVVPVYNAQRYLEEAMRSVLNQSYRDFELIAVDDGSKDSSLAILKRLAREDKRVRVISRPNTGIVGALNDGLAATKGKYIARMDADDVCLPDRFVKQLAYLESHPDCVLLGSMCTVIDPLCLPLYETERLLTHEELDRELMKGRGGVIRHPVAMIRREPFMRIGAYRQQYQWAEDLDLFLRLAEIGRIANLPDTLLHYRQHPQSVNRTRYEEQAKLITRVVREAAQRRGVWIDPGWQYDSRPPAAPSEQIREWGWRALKQKNASVARKHAFSLLRMSMWDKENWRLMACALRGY